MYINGNGQAASARPQLRVLFFVEGHTDIRFVTGLSEICALTMAVPAGAYHQSGLKERVLASGCSIQVDEIPGGRLRFKTASLVYLLRRAPDFDLILCQEVLRGAFNGTLAGRLKNVPVLTYMGVTPLEYYLCRRERRQIGPVKTISWNDTHPFPDDVQRQICDGMAGDGAIPARHRHPILSAHRNRALLRRRYREVPARERR